MFPLTDMVTSDQLEAQKRGCQMRIDRAAALGRLMKNRDFKSVMIDGFGEKECLSALDLASDSRLSDADRKDALAMAQAASHLRRFYMATFALGQKAESDVISINEQLAELRAEGLYESGVIGEGSDDDGALG